MAYPPPHHQEEQFENALFLVQQAPLATLISTKDNEVLCTHTPLVHQANNEFGVLVGHLDKFNPQCQHFATAREVTCIFHGPDVYISPSVYSTTQLPTWNYFKVHVKGILTLVNDREAIKQSLIDMTAFLEGNNPKYTLEADNPRMDRALDYIVGFRIEVSHWEGKYKISQDKRKTDQLLAKEALLDQGEAYTSLIEQLYSHHQTKSAQ